MENENIILEVENISKTYPGVKALSNVNLKVRKGEVLALVGENGAGKSTLMKALAGVHKTDPGSGAITLDGKVVDFQNSLEAKKAGLILIFQELSLVSELSVAENIFLGNLPKTKRGLIDWKKLNALATEIMQELELDIKADELVGNLSISKQQMVEIARALSMGAKVVIFDEPTSSLTESEKKILFKNIRKLKSKSVSIIYITHKMDEVFEITDRIEVLRDGRNTGGLITREVQLEDITQLMIGRILDDYFHKNRAEKGEEVLRLENLTLQGQFENINFTVKKGEVVGLYGLVGAGRSEIAETIFGARQPSSGKIYINGKEVSIKSTKAAVQQGIGFVPEDRKEQGLVMRMSCKENISLAKLPWINSYGFLKKSIEMEMYSEYKEKLSISTPGAYQKVENLSGGNQQKIVIAKWLSMDPKLLILDEPTRGIDVGSKAEIHKLISKAAESGYAVLVISSEMPEIMGVSDRIIAMRSGKITGVFTDKEVSEVSLLNAIAHVG